MESLIFVANGLYVASYFMQDMLRLRLLTVTAAACLAIYFYSLPEPMWTVIGWNLFFIGLNLVQIARVLRARKSAKWPVAVFGLRQKMLRDAKRQRQADKLAEGLA